MRVVKGRNRKPRHGQMAVSNAAFQATGRLIQNMSSSKRENPAMKAEKHPALLFEDIIYSLEAVDIERT